MEEDSFSMKNVQISDENMKLRYGLQDKTDGNS